MINVHVTKSGYSGTYIGTYLVIHPSIIQRWNIPFKMPKIVKNMFSRCLPNINIQSKTNIQWILEGQQISGIAINNLLFNNGRFSSDSITKNNKNKQTRVFSLSKLR